MTLASAQTFPIAVLLDRGVSEEAREIRRIRYTYQSTDSSFPSVQRQHAILEGLKGALVDAAAENPDAFEAFQTNPNAFVYAIEFLKLVPASVPFPALAIDNDGDIAVEWDYGPRNVISIRVAKDGTLHFASLVGFSAIHGVETLQEEISETILVWINRVVHDAAA